MTRNAAKSTTKKRSWPRRIVRFVLWTLAIFFILLLLVVVGLALYLTPQRIESIAEKTASQTLQQDLTFTNAHFNIFNGFVFEDIELSPPDSGVQTMLPVHSATAKKVALRYSLHKILKRQIIIASAVIDSPQVYVRMTPATAPTPQVEKEIIPADSTQHEEETGTSVESTQPMALPESFIAVELDNFRLKNAGITVDMLDSLQQQHIYFSDLSISLDDVSAPRGDLLAQDSLLHADFQLECRHSQCVFEQNTPEQHIRFAGEIDAKLDVNVNSLSSIQIDGFGELNKIYFNLDDQFSLTPKEFSAPCRAEFRGSVNAKTGTANFDPIAFKVDNQPWVSMSVNGDSLLTTPFINLEITESRIPIQQLVNIAQPFVPADVMPAIYLHNAKTHLSLARTHVSGNIPDETGKKLTCYASLTLQDFGATLNKGEHFLKNFDFKTELSALVGLTTVEQSTATATVSYDSVFITTADGQKVFSGHTAASVEAAISPALFPTLVKSELHMSNLLGSDIHGNLSLKSSGNFGSLHGAGDFDLNNIDISPFTQKQILSRVSVDAHLKLNSFDDIGANATVSMDSITLVQELEQTTFDSVTFHAEFKGATDTLFQNFAIRSLTAGVNDFVSAELTGTGSLAPDMRVDLNHLFASLDIAAALAWLPEKIKAPLAGLDVSGTTTLNSQAHLRVSQTDTVYSGALLVKTSDMNVNYQNGLAALTDIGVNVNGRINSQDSTRLSINVGVASASSAQLPDRTFYDNKFRLDLSTPDFASVHIDTGFVQLPDLKTSGTIGGLVRLVNNVPLIDAKISLTQNAADTIRLLPDFYYIGQNDININVRADSIVGRVEAGIRTTNLSASLPQGIRIEKINALLSVAQDIDLKNGALLISPGAVVSTPTDGLVDYRLYRNYYFQPGKNPSSLDIRRVRIGDYLVENIHADAFIGAGAVEIPYFALDVYGGNIGGSFSLLSDTDDIMQSTYKLSAHMSNINSSLLLPKLAGSSKGFIKAHTEISGKGLDITRGLELDGYFNITQIEAKVASNLLTLLDPEGKDTAISFTKLVMRYGYKPRLMTFDLQHGFCYPAIFFTQPWYNPARLSGGSIEFARIPVASLLEMNQ